MAKRVTLIFLMLLLSGFIITSQIFVGQKPVITKASNAQMIASLIKPSVVRVVQGYTILWTYEPPYQSDPQVDAVMREYLDSLQSRTDYYTTGSGAIISSDGYIVTNAHVVNLAVAKDEELLDQAIQLMMQDLNTVFQTDEESLYTFLTATVIPQSMNKMLKVVLPNGEVLDGQVRSYGVPTGEGSATEGKDVAVVKIDKTNLPTVRLGDSDKINLQDTVTIFGYPGAADSDMFSEESMLVVSITNGKVSAIDKKSAQGAPLLQVDAAATHGNSGGPIIDENGNLIGLLTFRSEKNPNEVQGFNFAVPVNTVKEFVAQAGAKNDPQKLDTLYKEGLELYWSGYYKEALSDFEEVKRIYPNHSDIQKLVSDAEQKVPESKFLWSKYKNEAMIADIACVVLILILLILLIFDLGRGSKKNKYEQPQPAYAQQSGGSYDNTVNAYGQRSPPANNYTPVNNYTANNPINNNQYNMNQSQPSQYGQRVLTGKLREISGPHKNSTLSFGTEPVVIGRDPRSCMVSFPADFNRISPTHCSVAYDPQRQLFILRDLSSNTGTFLTTGERVSPNSEKYLKSGDRFTIGSPEIVFEVFVD